MISTSSFPCLLYHSILKSFILPRKGNHQRNVLCKLPDKIIGKIAVLKKLAMKIPFMVDIIDSVSVWCFMRLSRDMMILLRKKFVMTTINEKPYETTIY